MFFFKRVGVVVLILSSLLNIFGGVSSYAQQNTIKIYEAKVLSVEDDSQIYDDNRSTQQLDIEIIQGPQKGRKDSIELLTLRSDQTTKVKKGQKIYVSISDDNQIFFADIVRLNKLVVIILIFFALVIAFSGFRGLWSILGLIASIMVIALYIIPNIMSGADPFLISIVGVLLAAFLTFYLAHGFNRKTTIALLGTLITLFIAAASAWLVTNFVGISGNFSEESSLLKSADSAINLQGLFLAGIMISTLGVLDDITTAQVAAVESLKKVNINISFKELYKTAFGIGKEHIVGLVNTLAFAYLGGSLVTILGFFVYQSFPWWYYLNTEFIMSEIIQSVVGSAALVLAVPITTWLAAKHYTKLNQKELNKLSVIKHTHTH